MTHDLQVIIIFVLKPRYYYLLLFRNRAKRNSLTAVNMVFLLMKTMFDCIARILIFSTWLYVTNEGRFCSSQTVIAYYNTLIILLFFNIVFNKTDDYCSVKTWIGI